MSVTEASNAKMQVNELVQAIKDQYKELREYRKNPTKLINNLYLEEIGGLMKFKPYKKQLEVIMKFLQYHYIITNKSRQTGISTIHTILCGILLCLYPNYSIGVISKSLPAAYEFIDKVRKIIFKLPKSIRPKGRLIEDNKRKLKLANGSFIIAAAVSMSNPSNTLRSEALAFLIIDEAAFIPKIDIAFSGIRPTLNKTKIVCQKKKIPYGISVISTPNGMEGTGQWYFQMVSNSRMKRIKYRYIEVPWWKIPGYDQAWYEEQCREEPDPRKIKQELDMKFLGSTECAFEDDVLETMQDSVNYVKNKKLYRDVLVLPDNIAHINESIRRKNKVRVFHDFKSDQFYYIGADIATLYGACKSTAQVIDARTGEQVAEYVSSATVDTMYYVLVGLMDMYPRCMLAFENNSIGNQLIEMFEKNDIIEKLGGKYISRLYVTIKKDKEGNVKSEKLGFENNKATRPLIMNDMFVAVCDNPNIVNSEVLNYQLMQLVDKNGRLMRANGKFDDAVLGFAIAQHLRLSNAKDSGMHSLHDVSEDELANMDKFIIGPEQTNSNDIDYGNLMGQVNPLGVKNTSVDFNPYAEEDPHKKYSDLISGNTSDEDIYKNFLS